MCPPCSNSSSCLCIAARQFYGLPNISPRLRRRRAPNAGARCGRALLLGPLLPNTVWPLRPVPGHYAADPLGLLVWCFARSLFALVCPRPHRQPSHPLGAQHPSLFFTSRGDFLRMPPPCAVSFARQHPALLAALRGNTVFVGVSVLFALAAPSRWRGARRAHPLSRPRLGGARAAGDAPLLPTQRAAASSPKTRPQPCTCSRSAW